MSTELVRHSTSYSRMTLQQRVNYSQTLAGAGDMIPSGLNDKATARPSPAKIFLVLETGSMLGLDPMAALQGIDVIEGRATIAPRLMLALIRAAGYRVKITERGTVEGGDFSVHVRAWDPADPDDEEEATFSIAMAARAGLCTYTRDQQTGQWTVRARARSGSALPWEMYPEDLTQWRAVSRMGKRGFGHILLGIAYTPEELEAVVGEDGTRADIVDTEHEAEIILRIKAIDDREDLRKLYQELRRADQLTPRIDAEITAHLMTLTKDSGVGEPGRPGHTGEPILDESHHLEAAAPVDESAPEMSDADLEREVIEGADRQAEEFAYAEEVPADVAPLAAEPPALIPEEDVLTPSQQAEVDAAALRERARAARGGFNSSAMGGTK